MRRSEMGNRLFDMIYNHTFNEVDADILAEKILKEIDKVMMPKFAAGHQCAYQIAMGKSNQWELEECDMNEHNPDGGL